MAKWRGLDGNVGAGLIVEYEGNENVQWRQEYRVQSPLGDTGWQHDGDSPYYDSSNSLKLPQNVFWDTSTTGRNTGLFNVNWSARDKVIDLATGRTIYTFTWGWSTDSTGNVTPRAPSFSH